MMAATVILWSGLSCKAQEEVLPLLISPWDYFFTGRTAFGYKDNVTLAHVNPSASSFVDSGAELAITRASTGGTEYTFFGSFEDHHFLSDVSVDQEQIGFGQLQLSRTFGQSWQAGLGLEYFYQDQILDVSATETNLNAVRVQGHMLLGRPTLRYALAPNYWLELQGPVQRQYLKEPLDNYWEAGPKFVLGHSYGYKSELSLSYESNYRLYDQARELTTEGFPIDGTHRRLWLNRVQWVWRHYWDQPRRWRTTTKLTYKQNQDNGSGYFNYTTVQLAEQVRYRSRTWEISGEVRLSQYQYEVRTVSLTNGSDRDRKELLFNVHAEKTLAKFLKVFAHYDREQVSSNLPLEEYSVNTVTGGLLWEF